ncbi:MAG TPA: hypothetical protein PLI96_08025 [Halothiobacillus sp.]|nr:hypothetical protein [Halothiobacillus sp.]
MNLYSVDLNSLKDHTPAVRHLCEHAVNCFFEEFPKTEVIKFGQGHGVGNSIMPPEHFDKEVLADNKMDAFNKLVHIVQFWSPDILSNGVSVIVLGIGA